MKPSPYQQAIFFALSDPSFGSILVDAKAGSGKTTTIVNGLSFLNSDSVLMLAFNKSIQMELSRRVPSFVNVATFHSVGFKAWTTHAQNRNMKVNGSKLEGLTRKWERNDSFLYGAFCRKMVGLGKNSGIGTYLLEDCADNWLELMSHFDINLQSEDADLERAIELCSVLLDQSISRDRFEIDFDDMLYAPLRERASFKRYDFVFIDEAQDTNLPQMELLKRMLTGRGRLIGVGDPRQSIYSFRGADSSAMPKMKEAFGCKVLPLSVSYRCAKNIVKHAKEIVPDIEAFEGSEDGIVDSLSSYTVSDFSRNDAVLCRNVAPLVKFAYSMISRGIGINFLGRDIGHGIISLIQKMKAADISELEVKLCEYRERETSRLEGKGSESAIAALNDKIECVYVCIENLDSDASIKDLISSIEDLFSDRGGLLTLSTCHSSKGKEWERVFILDSSLMPSKWAKLPWQIEQENNLKYVAITRAKKHLTYISSDCWK